ncbi:MAG TPA: hypothetical protein VH761_01850 [Ilumatobacteraceae bacterium]
MSNALMSAAESTVHAVSDAFSDLVEGARDRIEDLPPLRTHHKSHTGRWTLMIVLAVLGLLSVAAKRRGSTNDSKATDSTGAKMAERSLAVS